MHLAHGSWGGDKDACCSARTDVSICSLKRPSPSHGGRSDVEVLTAKELNALSIDDRERLFEEVNGISSTTDEDPNFITKCLFDLQDAIDGLHLDRSAYDLAMSMSPQFLNNRSFRLMFLRATCFDTTKAARLLVGHFDSKMKLFGEEKLVKRITYSDLDEDDRDALFTGAAQVLPSRDQSGRGIVFLTYKLMKFKSWKNQVNENRGQHVNISLPFGVVTYLFSFAICFFVASIVSGYLVSSNESS